MAQGSDLRRGMRILLDTDPYAVMSVHFQTPSARGASTLVKAKVRNLRTGNVFDRTFRAADAVDEAELEMRSVQYLYAEEETYHFMESESYEQFSLRADELGDDRLYLYEGLEGLRALVFNGAVISIELPTTVTLRIEETDPSIKGATAQAQTKRARLTTGLEIQVPTYLESGEAILVDTREGRFISRAKS